MESFLTECVVEDGVSINNSIPLWENIQPKFNEVSNNMSNHNQELSSIDITSGILSE